MLHFQMCNISNFAQISSVLAQRSTPPNRDFYASYISCCNSENKVKIDVHFAEVIAILKHRYHFFGPPCIYVSLSLNLMF